MCASATRLLWLALPLWQVRACVAPVDMTGDAAMSMGHATTDTEGQETGAHEPPPLGPAATPTNSIQPDVDEAGRDHYSETDAEVRENGFPGTFTVKDKFEAGKIDEPAHSHFGDVIMPRPYPALLYDGYGMPVMAPQLLNYLAGPEPKKNKIKLLIRGLQAFKVDDERGYAMVFAHFELGHSYRQIGRDYNVDHHTAHNTIVRFVEAVTTWVNVRWATELENAALAKGSLADDEGVTEQHPVLSTIAPATSSVDDEDRSFTRLTPIETYWRLWHAKRNREAYERGA